MTAAPDGSVEIKPSAMYPPASSISGLSKTCPAQGRSSPRAWLNSRVVRLHAAPPPSAGDYIALRSHYFAASRGPDRRYLCACAMFRCPPGELRPVETAVYTHFSSATVAQMMDRSSHLALCIGDQLKSVTKRLTENELSDFSRLCHDSCVAGIIESQDVDRNHSTEV